MKILVFGANGQLAKEVQRRAGSHELDIRGSATADFSDPEACAAIVAETDAQAIINTSAYTAVDKAETDEAAALAINATTPGRIAEEAAKRSLAFVHVSTDYVFDGSGDQPFTPDHPTGPLGAYGRTKLAGEDAIRAAGGVYAIFRTSWVVSAHGNNFIKTMLRLGAERDRLTIVADQIGGPTPAAALAEICLSAAEQLVADPGKTGTYHVSGAPNVSWADFAREIFAQSGITCEVADIPSSDYPTPAKRPHNSRMDNSATVTAFGHPQPNWTDGLADILKDLGALK